MLKNIYPHTRDDDIEFRPENHRYIIKTDPNVEYTSVTTWAHSNFSPFNPDEVIDMMMKSPNWKSSKYYGKTRQEIKDNWASYGKDCSSRGTRLHYFIEQFMNQNTNKTVPTHKDLYDIYLTNQEPFREVIDSIEWSYFINFIVKNFNLKPYRSEWILYNEDVKISGTVDMTYINDDGTLDIYDWKVVKNISRNSFGKRSINAKCPFIPDSNYYHYLLQLSMYKYLIETKYEKKVKSLNLVKLHINNRSKTYEILNLPILNPTIHSILF